MTRMRRSLLGGALWVVAWGGTGSAQVIEGVVQGGTGKEGLSKVAVSATSAATSMVVHAETDAQGLFMLRIPAPGVWQLQATRLGWSTTTAVVTVGDTPVDWVVLTMEIIPLSVEGLTAAVESGCDVRNGSASALVETLAWLRAMMLPGDESEVLSGTAVQVQTVTFIFHPGRFGSRGQVSGGTGVGWYVEDPEEAVWVHGDASIVETDPVRALEGFITPAIPLLPTIAGWVYHPVLLGALLSDGFVATHCFSVGELGVGSEPITMNFRPKKDAPADWHGVDGSMTVDPGAGTARIRYRYATLPYGSELWEKADDWNGRRPFDYARTGPSSRFGGEVDLVNVAGIGWMAWKANWSWPEITRGTVTTLRAGATSLGDQVMRTLWIVQGIRERRVEIVSLGVPD